MAGHEIASAVDWPAPNSNLMRWRANASAATRTIALPAFRRQPSLRMIARS